MTLQLPPSQTGRRTFLKRLAAAGALTIVGSSAGAVGPFGRPMKAWALPGDGEDTVIVNLFLRGGADGINIVAPHGDDGYYTVRPTLGLTAGEYTDLDGFFGLNNAFSGLYPHFAEGRLAVIHAAGSDHPTRSHFVAQPHMDTGFSDNGWLQRSLQLGQFSLAQSGLSMGSRVSPSLVGPWSGAVVSTLEETSTSAMNLAVARPAIEEMYADTRFLLEEVTIANALATLDEFSVVPPGDASAFPSFGLGLQLREAAAIIKADIGVRGVAIDYGGWDTHTSQTDRFVNLGSTFGGAVDSFLNDLAEAAHRVVVVVMTEFGRTARENGSFGTDHGNGNIMMVMGDQLQNAGGGQVHVAGQWPGLSPGLLHDNRDLGITTDFRTVLSEVLERHLGVDPGDVFPGYSAPYLDLLAPALPGDADQSGVVDAVDAQLVLDDITGQNPSGYNRNAADIDGDDRTGLLDALMISQADPN